MRFIALRIVALVASGLLLAVHALSQSSTPQEPPQTTPITQGQAAPVIPKTPDVVVPPPLQLPAPPEVQVGRQPLSLPEAIAIALQKQPQIGIARANILTSQGRLTQATSSLYPQFTANAGYTDQRTLRGSGGSSGSSGTSGGGTSGGGSSGSGGSSPNRFSAGVSVSQLLFDFGRTRDQVRQQSALLRATQYSFTRTQQTVAAQVSQAYYNLVQSIADVATSEANVANTSRQLARAQAMVTSGLGAPSDWVQAKTNMASAAIALTQARDAELQARSTLAQTLGIDPRTPITPTGSLQSTLPSETDLQALVGAALNNRPDILAAREQVAAGNYGLSAAQKNNLPRFNVTGSLNGRGPNDPLTNQTATFGVNVTWDFLDFGQTRGLIQEARGSQLAAQQNLIQISQNAVAEVTSAFVDLQSARQRVTLAQVEVANATELVRIAEGRYAGGLGQFLDITNAQSSLFNAHRSLTQAQEDVDRARARLRSAIGVI